MAPRISIIIPCYNHGHFLRDAIESVAKCPEGLWELIIVNDGSTEGRTLRVFDELRAQGYQIIDQENKGLGAARNTGVAAATSEYILPLDSDNKIRPEYLERGLEILDAKPEVGVVYGDAEYFGEKSGIWKGREFDLSELLEGNFIDACAVYRKTIWEEIGGYDTEVPYQGLEDWDFWLSVAEKNWEFRYVPEVLFDYRVRAGSMIEKLQHDGLEAAIDYVTRKHVALLRSEFQIANSTLRFHKIEIRKRPFRRLGKMALKALSGSDPFGEFRK